MKTIIYVEEYEVSHENGTNFKAKRNDEDWRDLTGDNFVLALINRIEELESFIHNHPDLN